MVVNASSQLAALAVRLKVAAARLPAEMLRGLESGARPLIPELQAAARERLPHRGGLNEHVAGQAIKMSGSVSGGGARVQIAATAPDQAETDQGYVVHPVFKTGRRVRQPLPRAAGWWSQTLAGKSPNVTAELVTVQAEITARIQGGI